MKNKFYVYAHLIKGTNKVFYIGKGCGNRSRQNAPYQRSPEWHKIVDEFDYNIVNFQEGLTEEEAFSLERTLIIHYRSKELVNKTHNRVKDNKLNGIKFVGLNFNYLITNTKINFNLSGNYVLERLLETYKVVKCNYYVNFFILCGMIDSGVIKDEITFNNEFLKLTY